MEGIRKPYGRNEARQPVAKPRLRTSIPKLVKPLEIKRIMGTGTGVYGAKATKRSIQLNVDLEG